MKTTIRGCISCILPCGALDVIRIVHASGRVEEIAGAVTADQILKLYPKHVLKKPSSAEGARPKIVVVPPDAELQRGKIYFLMPLPPPPRPAKRKKKELSDAKNAAASNSSPEDLLMSDRYLSEILSENVSAPKDRRRGRVGVWRPHLESICEAPSEA